MKPQKPEENSWNVYIVRCADGSLYTGIAKSLARRIKEHNTGNSGAKYTRTRRPVALAYSETCDSRSLATKREMAIKRLTKLQKEALVTKSER